MDSRIHRGWLSPGCLVFPYGLPGMLSLRSCVDKVQSSSYKMAIRACRSGLAGSSLHVHHGPHWNQTCKVWKIAKDLGIVLRRAPVFSTSVGLPAQLIFGIYTLFRRYLSPPPLTPSTPAQPTSYKRPQLRPRRWHRQFSPRRTYYPRPPRIRHNLKRPILLVVLILPLLPWHHPPLRIHVVPLQLNRHHPLRHQLHRLIIPLPILPNPIRIRTGIPRCLGTGVVMR